MKRIVIALFLLLVCDLTAQAYSPTTLKPLKSPDGRMEMTFKLWDFYDDGHMTYNLYRDGKAVVLNSRLGFTL